MSALSSFGHRRDRHGRVSTSMRDRLAGSGAGFGQGTAISHSESCGEFACSPGHEVRPFKIRRTSWTRSSALFTRVGNTKQTPHSPGVRGGEQTWAFERSRTPHPIGRRLDPRRGQSAHSSPDRHSNCGVPSGSARGKHATVPARDRPAGGSMRWARGYRRRWSSWRCSGTEELAPALGASGSRIAHSSRIARARV